MVEAASVVDFASPGDRIFFLKHCADLALTWATKALRCSKDAPMFNAGFKRDSKAVSVALPSRAVREPAGLIVPLISHHCRWWPGQPYGPHALNAADCDTRPWHAIMARTTGNCRSAQVSLNPSRAVSSSSDTSTNALPQSSDAHNSASGKLEGPATPTRTRMSPVKFPKSSASK